MTDLIAPPALSTAAEHLLQLTTHVQEDKPPPTPNKSEHEVLETYEVARTAQDLHRGLWTRIALQFPDSMLPDAPAVVESLHRELNRLDKDGAAADTEPAQARGDAQTKGAVGDKVMRRMYIMADTSYSACCVDEVAAEHVGAQVVVHYGRSCLSPTSRLPVVYVFTQNKLQLDDVAHAFSRHFPDVGAKVVLVADVTFQHHVPSLAARLRQDGFRGLLSTSIVHDPTAPIPNRRILNADGHQVLVGEAPNIDLAEYSIFHVSNPPAALLLVLSTRAKSLHIYPTLSPSSFSPQNTRALLGRRYARVLSLAAAGIIGVLVNTLSVSNYLSSLENIQRQIAQAGKKSYTVVVGKLNPAKLANFAEVDGWVVVGCWESSLVEDDAGFFKPVVTPFELSTALESDDRRVWGGEWWGGIENVQSPNQDLGRGADEPGDAEAENSRPQPENTNGGVDEEESEPPDFDLRTGRLISRSRPMQAVPDCQKAARLSSDAPPASSQALSLRPQGELVTINGAFSPGAEYLRCHRTWQGLGSEFGTAEGSTAVEEGRSGVARGYTVGGSSSRT